MIFFFSTARLKLGYSQDEGVHLVLEADGTHIDDDESLNWLPDNTTFQLLRGNESWARSGGSLRFQQLPHQQHEWNAPNVRGARDRHPFNPAGPGVPEAAATTEPMQVFSPIPRVVCEALNLLEIHHEPPFWKIIDNRGRITLVLHWEQPRNNHIRYVEPILRSYPMAGGSTGTGSDGNGLIPARSLADLRIKSVPVHPNEDIITLVSEDGATVTTVRGGRMETLISTGGNTQQLPGTTVGLGSSPAAAKERIQSKSNSIPTSAANHSHSVPSSSIPFQIPVTGLTDPTVSFATSSISPAAMGGADRMGSQHHHHHHHHHGQQHRQDECEFHCLALHEEGRTIHGAEGRSSTTTGAAASGNRSNQHPSSSQSKLNNSPAAAGKTTPHVRFHGAHADGKTPSAFSSMTTTLLLPQKIANYGRIPGIITTSGGESKSESMPIPSSASSSGRRRRNSSESEVEPESSNTIEEEFENETGITTDKLLLLTDQLSTDQRKHLTILDLGVILERLKAKIIDVERLEREREGPSCFRWMIKATIRGEVLRDLGVLYNGNYYSISEDPGIPCAASGFEDEDEDREDPI